MKRVTTPIDLDDPRILKLGKALCRCAESFANELVSCGADSDRLLHAYSYRDLPDDGEIRIPAQSADCLLVILRSLPRSKPGPRPKSPTQKARQLVAAGMSKRGAAQMVAKETGESAENLRRRLR